VLPNFLVIGAGRAGTTSLHHYLKAHPAVYLPAVKSPSHFYCTTESPGDGPAPGVTQPHFVADPRAYAALFSGVRGETAIGEVSPAYLATLHAAPRIAARLPRARLVAIVRHPVDRAFARFVGRLRDGLESRTRFEEVVRDELQRPLERDDAVGTYLPASWIGHFLASYCERFPREQIRIHLFEDFQRDPLAVMQDIYAFLGVDPRVTPDVSRRHNLSGGIVRNPLVRTLWSRTGAVRAGLRAFVPASIRDRAFGVVTRDLLPVRLDPALRADLTALYRSDIERVSVLIGRDLSHWLQPADAGGPHA
jgi:hypothetical protein